MSTTIPLDSLVTSVVLERVDDDTGLGSADPAASSPNHGETFDPQLVVYVFKGEKVPETNMHHPVDVIVNFSATSAIVSSEIRFAQVPSFSQIDAKSVRIMSSFFVFIFGFVLFSFCFASSACFCSHPFAELPGRALS